MNPEAFSPWPLPDPEIQAALAAALTTGSWGQYLGPAVPAFEADLAAYHGVPFAVTCASGTLAIETALRALKVGSGDEIIMSAYDYEPNFLCVHAVGALPVLVDVAESNANLDPNRVVEAITPKTKAILASHLHGGSVPMPKLVHVAQAHQIPILEDACQASGGTIYGRRAGTWGDVGVLSFGGSKLLCAGRGGAILTARADIHQRARLALRRGNQQWAPLSELQALVLRPQLARLDERNRHRAANVARLLEQIRAIPGLEPFTNEADAGEPAYYKLGFWFDADRFGMTRDGFITAMRAARIAFSEGFRALHVGRTPSRFRAGSALATADRAHEQVVALHHPVLLGDGETIAKVAQTLEITYRSANRPQPKGS